MEKKTKKRMYIFYTNKPLENKTKTLILQINYFLLKKEKNQKKQKIKKWKKLFLGKYL